jgi:hypothetical protein
MDRTLRRLAVLSVAAGLAPLAAADGTLQTWHPWQLDSVLVAWALTQAQSRTQTETRTALFESITRGTEIAPERAIDTPDSPYRRTGQRTAFEEAVRLNRVDHPCVPRLRDAVRVVELAAWRKPAYPAVEAFEARVLKLTPAQPMRGGLDAALAEVDRYCREPE